MPADYNSHMEALDIARKQYQDRQQSETQHGVVNTAKNITQTATPAGFFSALKQASLLKDLPFVAAFIAAGLKDLLDLVLVGSLPGIGTVMTIICSIFIGMMMFLSGNSEKSKKSNAILKRVLMLGGGTMVEFIPGINFFPIGLATVLMIYVSVLSERANAEE